MGAEKPSASANAPTPTDAETTRMTTRVRAGRRDDWRNRSEAIYHLGLMRWLQSPDGQLLPDYMSATTCLLSNYFVESLFFSHYDAESAARLSGMRID